MKVIIILLYCVLCVISVYTPSSGGKDTYEFFIDVKVGLSNNISTTYSGIKIGTDLALLNVTLYIDGNYTSECIMKSQCIFPSKNCGTESHVYVITVAPAFNNTNFVVVGYTFDGDACGAIIMITFILLGVGFLITGCMLYLIFNCCIIQNKRTKQFMENNHEYEI